MEAAVLRKNVIRVVEVLVFLFLLLFFMRYLAMDIFLFHGDTYAHINFIDPYINNEFFIPHPGFQIIIYWLSRITTLPYYYMADFFIAAVIVFTIYITKRISEYVSPGIKSPLIYLFLGVSINILMAIYIPVFNENMYLGQWSPNYFLVPTLVLLKPFALLSFFIMAIYLKEDGHLDPIILIICSIGLFLGTFIKPSFIICFIPATALFLIFFKFKKFRLYLKTFLVFLPSILLLTYQFLATFGPTANIIGYQDKIMISWFGVWDIYTRSIIISSLLVLAFPIVVLSISFKKVKKDTFLSLGLILLLVSFIIAGFFAEEKNFTCGNFIFGYEISLFILYVFSLCEFLKWLIKFKENKRKIVIAGMVFLAHLVSGFLYLFPTVYHGTIQW